MGQIIFRGRFDDRASWRRTTLIQFEPCRRTVSVGFPNQYLYVSLPYCLFAVNYTFTAPSRYSQPALRAFFSNTPIRSLEDRLALTCFHNCDQSGCVCLGEAPIVPDRGPQSEEEVIERTIESFWATSFTGPGLHISQLGGNLHTLAAQTRIDPEAAMRIDWLQETDLWQVSHFAISCRPIHVWHLCSSMEPA